MDEIPVIRKNEAISAQNLSMLLHAVAHKDQSAFEDLYRQCRRSVFLVAYAITRDIQWSEDICQETLLYVWNHAGDFRFGTRAKAWLLTIARHFAVDRVRKNYGTISMEDLEENALPKSMVTYATSDMEIALWMGIDRLGAEEAKVFILKAMLGLRHAETASLLNIPYQSVHYRYRKAVAQLREYMSDQEVEK